MQLRLLSHRSGDLVTAAIVREGDGSWTLSWIHAGCPPTPRAGDFDFGGVFQALDEAVELADAVVRDRYANERQPAGVLQYAIFPWRYEGCSDAVFHMSGSPEDLAAVDISSTSGLEVHGRTAEELVSQVSTLLGPQSKATFRWIREIRKLQGTN